jgi:hypothetical protein
LLVDSQKRVFEGVRHNRMLPPNGRVPGAVGGAENI